MDKKLAQGSPAAYTLMRRALVVSTSLCFACGAFADDSLPFVNPTQAAMPAHAPAAIYEPAPSDPTAFVNPAPPVATAAVPAPAAIPTPAPQDPLPFINPTQAAAPVSPPAPAVVALPVSHDPTPFISSVQAGVTAPAPVPVAIPTAPAPYVADQQALFNAVDIGNPQLVKIQVNAATASGHNILEIRDADGNTPLIRAEMEKKTDIADYLISKGANINAQNIKGQTALTVSYDNRDYDEARYLLSKGAVDPYNVGGILKQIDVQQASNIRWGTVAEYSGVALAAGGVAAAFAGGGGSGGGSSSVPTGTINPESLNPASFVTAGAVEQLGFTAMNTQYALALGYNGSIYSRNSSGFLNSDTPTGNVKVAVVDTGVDLTQTALAANILTADSVTCSNTGCVSGGTDTEGHGTMVAGIISAQMVSSSDMYGIAPDAKIMSIGFADSTGTLTNGDIPGIKTALDNGAQVFNGSYGIDNSYLGGPSALTAAQVATMVNTNIAGTTYLAQFERGVAQQNAIFVYAAGNDTGAANPIYPAALPYYFQGAIAPSGITQATYDSVNPNHYDWSKNWVAVVSVTETGGVWQISSFSNSCGIAAAWCLAAPGENTTSTKQGGGYTTGSGTSFAAPNVTGAIADMLGAFPQLTPEKVLQILFDTATPLGSASIYGYGLINLQKATSPSLGGWSLTSATAIAPYSFYTSGVGLSAPFGNALSSSKANIQFLDSYGKNYIIPLTTVAQNLTPAVTLQTRFAQFGATDFDTVTHLSDNAELGFSPAPLQQNPGQTSANPYGKFSYQFSMPEGSDGQNKTFFAINFETNLADALSTADQKKLTLTDAYKNPYLGLVDAANSSVAGMTFGQSQLSMAVYSGNYTDEYIYAYADTPSITGMVTQYKYTGNDTQSNIALNSGVSIEQNGFLGSEASGAFGVSKASTYYGGVSGKYALNSHMSIIGDYYMGMTRVESAPGSLFTGFDNVVSNAFAAGTEYTGLARENDSLTFTFSQPLRVISGAANLTLPTGISDTGDNLYSMSRLSLNPSGRELDMEGDYNLPLDKNNALDLSVLFSSEPYNGTLPSNNTVVIGKYSLNF